MFYFNYAQLGVGRPIGVERRLQGIGPGAHVERSVRQRFTAPFCSINHCEISRVFRFFFIFAGNIEFVHLIAAPIAMMTTQATIINRHANTPHHTQSASLPRPPRGTTPTSLFSHITATSSSAPSSLPFRSTLASQRRCTLRRTSICASFCLCSNASLPLRR